MLTANIATLTLIGQVLKTAGNIAGAPVLASASAQDIDRAAQAFEAGRLQTLHDLNARAVNVPDDDSVIAPAVELINLEAVKEEVATDVQRKRQGYFTWDPDKITALINIRKCLL